jgi:hypothetical protein
MTEASELEQPLAHISTMIGELEQLPDRTARERARTLVQAVLDLHRAGLARILELAGETPALVDAIAADETVSVLLALHELHPRPLVDRVAHVVDALRPKLREQGVEVEVAEVAEDTARVRVRAGGAVHVSPSVLRRELEEAIGRGAPEIAAVVIEGLEHSDVPVSRLKR